jgi:hypothetical protein
MAESLLNLNTSTPRRLIRIDGKPYKLRHPWEFSFADQIKIGAEKDTLAKLADLGGLDEAGANNLSESLKRMLETVIVDSGGVAGKLTDNQRLQVLTVFLPQAGAKPAPKKKKKR